LPFKSLFTIPSTILPTTFLTPLFIYFIQELKNRKSIFSSISLSMLVLGLGTFQVHTTVICGLTALFKELGII
jgi:hypothetical protein